MDGLRQTRCLVRRGPGPHTALRAGRGDCAAHAARGDGGNQPLAYMLVPALPEGLARIPPVDAASGRMIAGTPEAVQGSHG